VPFSGDEQGYHPGEGGAFMLLESLDEALERKAKIYAELVGFGMSTDSNPEMTQNDTTGANLIKAIEEALMSGNVGKEEIGWISCTERGIDAIRQAESNGIRHFWGDKINDISLINTIPFTGWLDSVSPLMNLSAMLYSALNKEAVPRHEGAASSLFASALMNKNPAPERKYGMCLGVAREGFNYAMLVKPYA
jgi:3-oxoacyl-(acyl-carrier-protein) synthase